MCGVAIAGLVSQRVARRFNHANFDEAVLLQHGHEMAHVVPPRDLRSWQNLPISAIPQFTPVTLEGLEAPTIAQVLESRPYQRFPVVREGRIEGILLRSEAARASAERRLPRLVSAVCARPSQTIRECQGLLIASECGLIVITDQPGGIPLAVVALHDLLRAQAPTSEREG